MEAPVSPSGSCLGALDNCVLEIFIISKVLLELSPATPSPGIDFLMYKAGTELKGEEINLANICTESYCIVLKPLKAQSSWKICLLKDSQDEFY